jgi:hypothetical protein
MVNMFYKKIIAIVAFTSCLASVAQTGKTKTAVNAPGSIPAAGYTKNISISDSALLDLVQKQTFRYFWDFAHPVSGLARERSNVVSNYGPEATTTGGTGFAVMAIVVATERKWISREEAVDRLLKIVNFLSKGTDRFRGAFPHFLDGATGRTIVFSAPYSSKDDGADLVETSFLVQGLLCVREYFTRNNSKETQLRNKITWMWNDIEWNWFARDAGNVLSWHWSPNNGWTINNEIRGWNECLITYVLAASSRNFAIDAGTYYRGWTNGINFKNQREYYGIKLPLGDDYGGPLFFSHYSFLGIDPRGLKDRYADYWEQNVNHTLINREHCIRNPKKFKGYGPDCWGLTASDNHRGYGAHSPTEDLGVISPTAALSAFPYTPEFSMKALKHFYNDHGDKIWSEYGFVDAFNETENWYAKSHLAIDQGPIIVMIENYRSGLLWKLFMNIPEVQTGLKKIGFSSPYIQ